MYTLKVPHYGGNMALCTNFPITLSFWSLVVTNILVMITIIYVLTTNASRGNTKIN